MARDLLDLHGFKADEVEPALDRFLVQASNAKLKKARIMTGKGTGKVQSIVIKYLKIARYPWAYDKSPNGKPNEGCLVVFID